MESVGEEEVRGSLAQLERKELIRAARPPAVEGQAEYSFWHVLIRDVAYAQVPRTSRSAATGRPPSGSRTSPVTAWPTGPS
jgi:predicted ATPase